MQDNHPASQFALQLLHMLIITGDRSIVKLALQRHLATLLPLSDEQFSAELQAILAAYHVHLAHLDIFAAANRPESLGLRELIKPVIEEWLQDDAQTR